MTAVAGSLWAAWGAVHAIPLFRGWGVLGHGLAGVSLAGIGPAGVAAAAGRHLGTIGLAALAALAVFNLGVPSVRLLRPRDAGRGERAALGLLSGYVLLGTGYLGLGLAGLFSPLPLVAIPAAALLAPAGWRAIRDLAHSRPAVPGWAALALIPAALTLVAALVPSTYVDVYAYHLAAPETFLRLRRFTLYGAPFGFQCPLTAELVSVLAVVADRDALANLLQLIPFVPAVALLADWAARSAGAAAGWLAIVGIATMGLVEQQALLAKHCLASAAYPMAAVALALRAVRPGAGVGRPAGPWLAFSALLFGAGAALKWSGYPLLAVGAAAVFVLAFRRAGWRGMAGWCVLASLPVWPWLAKSWLFMGDPAYPFLSAWLPGALWDAESGRATALLRASPGSAQVLALMVPSAVGFWWVNQPAVGCLLPAVAGRWGSLGRETRWLAGTAFAGWAVLWIAMPREAWRLALPVWALWTAAAAVAAGKRFAGASRGVRRLGAAAVVAAGWLAAGPVWSEYVLVAPAASYLLGGTGQQGYIARATTTYAELGEALGCRGVAGGVLAVSEERSYRLPGRHFAGRFYGRNWPWALAGECRTPGGIRKRLRQLGVRWMVQNVVTDLYPHDWLTEFPWSESRLRVWKAFVARWTRVAIPPSRMDMLNGGFAVHEILDAPRPAPRLLPYLPGINALLYPIVAQPDQRKAHGEAVALARRLPDVVQVRNVAAVTCIRIGDWPAAYRYLEPGIRAGVVDFENLYNFGKAAMRLGRNAEAEEYLRKAQRAEPDLGPSVDTLIEAMHAAGGAP